jgi:hypothetical protein
VYMNFVQEGRVSDSVSYSNLNHMYFFSSFDRVVTTEDLSVSFCSTAQLTGDRTVLCYWPSLVICLPVCDSEIRTDFGLDTYFIRFPPCNCPIAKAYASDLTTGVLQQCGQFWTKEEAFNSRVRLHCDTVCEEFALKVCNTSEF